VHRERTGTTNAVVLDEADRIWNRTCDPFVELSRTGDRALQALLLVHGLVMNGGFLVALEYNTPDEIHNAVAGYRYFGLDEAAGTLTGAYDLAYRGNSITDAETRGEHLDALHDDVHERLERMQGLYYAAVPGDHVLEASFRERLRESPEDFAAPQ
jgi:hypothetical protein